MSYMLCQFTFRNYKSYKEETIINKYNNTYRNILIYHPQNRILLVRGHWFKTVNCQNCQTFIDLDLKIFYNGIPQQENLDFKRTKVGL